MIEVHKLLKGKEHGGQRHRIAFNHSAPSIDTATTEALRYMAHTKQRRTYLPYTFPAVAGTHLPTAKGWRVE